VLVYERYAVALADAVVDARHGEFKVAEFAALRAEVQLPAGVVRHPAGSSGYARLGSCWVRGQGAVDVRFGRVGAVLGVFVSAYQTRWIDTAVMAVNPAANRQNPAANQSGEWPFLASIKRIRYSRRGKDELPQLRRESPPAATVGTPGILARLSRLRGFTAGSNTVTEYG
jgi:hypothetical protein